jgi:hypothetical protein
MAEPVQKIVRRGSFEKGNVLPTSHVTAPMPPVQPPRPAPTQSAPTTPAPTTQSRRSPPSTQPRHR